MGSNYKVDVNSKVSIWKESNYIRSDDLKIFKNNSRTFLLIRNGKNILCFEYYVTLSQVKKVWDIEIFHSNNEHDLFEYPWHITTALKIGDYQIVLRTELGLRIIKVSNDEASEIASDGLLHDAYGFTSKGHGIKIGAIFQNTDKLGIIFKDPSNTTKIFALDQKNILKNPKNCLLQMKKKIEILKNDIWKNYHQIYLNDIENINQDYIILRISNDIYIYKFNEKYDIAEVTSFQFLYNENEKIIFGKLTGGKYKDILIFNPNGLFIYQFTENNYEFMSYHSEFSIHKDWDINLHGKNVHLLENQNLVISQQFGISVFSYDDFKWKTILKTKEDNFDVLGVNDNSAFIFRDFDGNIFIVKMLKELKIELPNTQIETKILRKYDLEPDFGRSIPEVEDFKNIENKVLRWVQKYDSTQFFKDILHPITGSLTFTLPLVDIPYDYALPLSLQLSYDSSTGGESIFGMGWNTNIAPQFISVNHGDSIFTNDHTYILNSQRDSIPLILIEDSAKDVFFFKILNEPQIKSISYNKTNEEWQIESEDEIKIYGGKIQNNSQYLHHSLHWEHWNGAGKDVNNLKPIVIGWYLKMQQSKLNTLNYSYIHHERSISQGKNFTSQVLINRIFNNKDTAITFNYDKKDKNEYIEPAITTNDGKYRFPIATINTHYLKDYHIVTDAYEQQLNFIYNKVDNNRLLVKIDQTPEENILKFDYDNCLMNEILLPTQLKIKIKYEEIKLNTSNVKEILKFPVFENPQINGAVSDFVIMSNRVNASTVLIRLLDPQHKFLIFSTVIHSSGSEINRYIQFILNKTTIFVIVFTITNVEIHVITKDKKKWTLNTNVKMYMKDSLVTSVKNAIVIYEPNSYILKFLSRENNNFSEETITISTNIQVLVSSSNVLVYYDDIKINIAYKQNNTWVHKILTTDLKSYLESNILIFNQFDLEHETKKEILNKFKEQSLQISNNIIIMNKFQILQNILSLKIKMFTLDSSYDIVQTQDFEIGHEKLLEIRNENISKNIVFKYIRDSQLYKIKIADINGKYVEGVNSIKNSNIRSDEKIKVIKHLENELEEKNLLENVLLIDLKLYFVQMTTTGILYGTENSLLEFSGSQYEISKIPKYISHLKSDIILEEINPTLLEIYNSNSNELIRQIRLKSQGSILNRFPFYIAYQNIENNLQILTFDKNINVETDEIFKDEVFLFQSDYNSLMSFVNSTTTSKSYQLQDKYEIRIRSTNNFVAQITTACVSYLEYSDSDSKRLKTFERSFEIDEDYNNKIIFRSIPGGNTLEFGYTESLWYQNKIANEWRNMITIFNNNGDVVNQKEMENKSDKKVENSNNNVIMDKSKRLILVDINPYQLADNAIGFIGFQDYEISNEIWKFENSNIRKNDFAYTGDNVLRLSNNSSLTTIFNPVIQNGIYHICAYIRTNVALEIGNTVSLLKAKMSIESDDTNMEQVTFVCQVKEIFGDWTLAQIALDFDKVNNLYISYLNYKEFEIPESKTAKFYFEIIIKPEENEYIDVDNIAIYPTDFDFKAFVFNHAGKQISMIRYNEPVTKNIYSYYDHEVCAFYDNGAQFQLTLFNLSGNNKKQLLHTTVFISENGFYENFDENAFRTKWTLTDVENWRRSLSKIKHQGRNMATLQIEERILNKKSNVILFTYQISKNSKIEIYDINIIRGAEETTMLTISNHYKLKINNTGKLAILKVSDRLVVWYENLIIFDRIFASNYQSLKFEVSGNIVIEDFVLLNDPEIRTEYKNAWGEKLQVINYVDHNEIIIHGTLYDSQGRDAITTQLTKLTDQTELLSYRENFVKFSWESGIMNGEVSKNNLQDNGYCYSRKVYCKNPMNDVCVSGLPGDEHCVSCKHHKIYSNDPKNDFVSNKYPKKEGFHKKVEEYSDGSKYVNVFDAKNNQIALYTHVNNFDQTLGTYEYNDQNQIVKVLSPNFYEHVNSLQQFKWNVSSNNTDLEQTMGCFNEYNSLGNLIYRKSPDYGDIEYQYNLIGQLKFMIFYKFKSNIIDYAVEFEYDSIGQLFQTSYITDIISKSDLLRNDNANKNEHQSIFYVKDSQVNSIVKQIKKFITTNEEDTRVIDELYFDASDKIIEKRFSVIRDDLKISDFQISGNVEGKYKNSIRYPFLYKNKPLEITYIYDKRDHLIGIGVDGQNDNFVSIKYHANGQVSSENFFRDTSENYVRNFENNSPGYLTKISDKYLTQILTYTKGGYGQIGGGNGYVMSSTFQLKWIQKINKKLIQIHEYDLSPYTYRDICFNALKQLKYIDLNAIALKELLPDFEINLPLLCRGNYELHLSELISSVKISLDLQNSYSYGNHRELIRAKYNFDGKIYTLNPTTFNLEIPGISEQQSKDIWNILIKTNTIITDRASYEDSNVIGKKGELSIYRKDELIKILKSNDAIIYVTPILNLLTYKIVKNEILSKPEFDEVFKNWIMGTPNQNISNKLFDLLISGKFIYNYEPYYIDSISLNLRKSLEKYKPYIPDIIRVLNTYFIFELGKSSLDMESYEIDSNGNHKKFYNGFDRYELSYESYTNKISKITISTPVKNKTTYNVEYDSRGNIVSAEHLGIKSILNHPVIQRPTLIAMQNGITLKFSYDAQGERALKQVFDRNGFKTNEIFYFRNEKGQVLYDKYTYYMHESDKIVNEVKTVYLYGPRGIIGFIRDDQIHTIFTDHTGSVRLIISNNNVVASFDYSPYGKIVKKYGQINFNYLFTGKELDIETGLYNFHSRLYDPLIGRFYQPDPKEQYFSPYKYAGNSPISLVDQDGELAFLTMALIATFAVAGAYLGGAAANQRWNLNEWDYKDPGTWLGIIGGSVAGAVLPLGFAGSAAFIGTEATISLGYSVAYISAAAANDNQWDFTKWDYSNPKTFNALFQGFGTGSGIVGFSKLPFDFAVKTFASQASRILFLTGSFAVAGGAMYGSGIAANDGKFAFWEWDWSKPSTLLGVIDGFDSGFGWPQGFAEIGLDLFKLVKNSKQLFSNFVKNNPKVFDKIKRIVKNTQHPLNRIIIPSLVIYFTASSANEDFDIRNWNGHSFKTYEGILNGLFMGKDLPNISNLVKKIKPNKPKTKTQDLSYYKSYNIKFSQSFAKLVQKLDTFQIKDFFKHPKKIIDSIKSTDLKLKVEEFYKKGFKDFKIGVNKIPDGLLKRLKKKSYDIAHKNLLENGANRIDSDAKRAFEEKHRIDTEDNVKFLGCGRSRRSRRDCKTCVIKQFNYLQYDNKSTQNFVKNPKQFLENYPLLEFRAHSVHHGNQYALQIHKNDDNIYFLKPTNKNTGLFSIYFNRAEESIKIQLNDTRINYLFTSEFNQGSIIYTKLHKFTNELELFHYNSNEKECHLLVSFDGKNVNYFDSINFGSDQTLYGKYLYDSKGNLIKSDEKGLILIDQVLYYKRDGGELIRLNKIGNKMIEDCIENHEKFISDDKKLMNYYDNKIQYDFNIAMKIAMDAHFKNTSITHETIPLFYRDENNMWNFFAQTNQKRSESEITIFSPPVDIPIQTTDSQRIQVEHNLPIENVHSGSSQPVSILRSVFSYISEFRSYSQFTHHSKNEFLSPENFTNVSVNDTLLLADLCARKLTKSKPIVFKENKISHFEMQGCAIDIVNKFEIILDEMCDNFKIDIENIIFEPVSLQSKILKLLIKGDVNLIQNEIIKSIKINKTVKNKGKLLNYIQKKLELI